MTGPTIATSYNPTLRRIRYGYLTAFYMHQIQPWSKIAPEESSFSAEKIRVLQSKIQRVRWNSFLTRLAPAR